MKFKELYLKDAYIIELDLLRDERGFFARTFCRQEFTEKGLNPCVAQCNLSFNKKAGTLRGLHYQTYPYPEAKLLSCIKGSIYDIIVDLRENSATFRKWAAVALSEQYHAMLYIPENFAHGFQTLEDNTSVYYQISEKYHPEYAQGIRWNDPELAIPWPITKKTISERDNSWPFLHEIRGDANA